MCEWGLCLLWVAVAAVILGFFSALGTKLFGKLLG